MKPTKSGGQALVCKVVITQGEYQNVEFDEWLNIVNSNETAVKIAYDTLAEIAKAQGMAQTPADSSQLHNRPMIIDIKTEEGKNWTDNDGNEREGKPRSVIKKYLPMTGGSVQQPAQQNTFAAPAQNTAPAQQQQAPVQQQTAAPVEQQQQPVQQQPAQSLAAQAPVNNPFATPQG